MSVNNIKIGLLALQGDYQKHREGLERAASALSRDVRALEVRTPAELNSVDALVMPGGESSAMLKLMPDEMRNALVKFIEQGRPVLATCAGVILLAHKVENPEQASLDLIDIDVKRNAYGRQVDSFIDSKMELANSAKTIEGVFIRAPRITRVGSKVEVLSRRGSEKEPVAVRQGKIIAATFHPELSENALPFYQTFFDSL